MANPVGIIRRSGRLIIEIRNRPRPIAALIPGILAAVSFLFPLAALVFALKHGKQIGPPFLFTLLVFWGTAYFTVKIYLWNTRGKETFEIQSRRLVHAFHFGPFRVEKESVSFRTLTLEPKRDHLSNEIRLQFRTGRGKATVSFLKIDDALYSGIRQSLEDYLRSTGAPSTAP